MKIKRLVFKLLILSFFVISAFPLYAEDSAPKPYEEDEFPQSLKDLRRFEIITIGALPFVTLDTTLAYSTYRYARNDFDDAYKPDIFSPSSFTQEEQKGIILTSVGVCVGIGLTDFIVQIIKRSSKRKIRPVNYDDISVIPISEDEDAAIIPLPQTDSEANETIQEIEE